MAKLVMCAPDSARPQQANWIRQTIRNGGVEMAAKARCRPFGGSPDPHGGRKPY